MKQLTAVQQQQQQQGRRSSESTADGSVKSPSTVFWLLIHGFCCLISLLLGFRFSRLVLFLVIYTSSSPSATTTFTALRTALPAPPAADINASSVGGGSRVVVGRHGILIRPWPHPDPAEVMKAHEIISRVQLEQRSQFQDKNPRTVIVITPTYVRTFQTLHLTGLMHYLMNAPYDIVWIVVEAGGAPTEETAALISKSGLKTIHIGFDGKMPLSLSDRHNFESKMRLHALRVVREKRLDGIVMFGDDSNIHSLELFDEIQKVKWIGAFPVGILGSRMGSPLVVQGPACNASGHFPEKVEWAGFAFNSRLVWDGTDKPGWVKELGDEVQSPLSLLTDASMVEPLGGCGRKVLLWWMRVEARADSKFPARWIIDPPLSITVRAKRTPWPDTPPELPMFVDKSSNIQDSTESHATKRGRKHRTPRIADERSMRQSEGK